MYVCLRGCVVSAAANTWEKSVASYEYRGTRVRKDQRWTNKHTMFDVPVNAARLHCGRAVLERFEADLRETAHTYLTQPSYRISRILDRSTYYCQEGHVSEVHLQAQREQTNGQ